MPGIRWRSVAAVTACVLVVATAALAGACGGDEPAADYEGHWYSTELVGEWWLTIEPDGDEYLLTWERLPADRYTECATLQDDGSLLVEGSALGVTAEDWPDNPERFYRLALNDEGRLEIGGRTTEDKALSEPTKPIMTRGDDADYEAFKAKLQPAIEKVEIDADYGAAVDVLRFAISAWAKEHGGQAPPVDEVQPGGAIDDQLQADGDSWPVLLDGRQLLPGRGPGEFSYSPRGDGRRIAGLTPTGERQTWTWSL